MIALQQIDPDKCMFRIFVLSLQPDLFGHGAEPAKEPQERHEFFDEEDPLKSGLRFWWLSSGASDC